MRVIGGHGTTDRRRERGVAAPIIGICLVVIIAMAAMVIDYGSLWQHRRQMVIATDAGALAAAQEYAEGGNGCATSGPQFYEQNAPATAGAPDCQPMGLSSTGTVTVSGSVDVDPIFGAILGVGDQPIAAATTASWQQPISASGLRPIGLCLPALLELAGGVPVFGDSVVFPWDYEQPDLCGGEANGGNGNGGDNGNGGNSTVPGSWGLVDFDETGNGGLDLSQVAEWTLYGYDGDVPTGATYNGFQGGHANLEPYIETLIANGECVGLPIYEAAISGGGTDFYVTDLATGYFRGVDLKGAPASRYFTFEFAPCVIQGEGGGGGTDFGARVIRICRVDNSADDCP